MELVCKGNILQRLHGIIHAVRSAFGTVSAHDHFRVVQEIAVDGVPIFRLPQMHPVRFYIYCPVTFLQEQNIRHYFRTCIGLKGGVGQTNSAQQVSPLGEVLADAGVLGIHGIAAGHESYYTTGAYLVQRFGEEIIVDVEAQLVIGRIIYFVLAERHITYRKVEKVSAVCGFKTCNSYIGLGIKLLGDPSGDGIQFYTVKAAALHIFREHSKEIADTHGRLQNVTGLEAHISHSFIDGTDNRGAGIVSIQRGRAGGGIFLRGKRGF